MCHRIQDTELARLTICLVLVLITGGAACAEEDARQGASRDAVNAQIAAEQDPEERVVLLEAALRDAPDDLWLGDAFRRDARLSGRTKWALETLESLVAAHPEALNLRANLALAHLDRLGEEELDVATRGILVHRTERHCTRVLDADEDHWVAHLGRGLARMLWPRSQGHLNNAIADLEFCFPVLEDMVAEPARLAPLWRLLGDAYAKNLRPQTARDAYEEARHRLPELEGIAERLALEDRELIEFAATTYAIDSVPDADLGRYMPAESE